MPRISVTIINWNTHELLLRCLASLRADPASAGWQVVVIDNGSDEDPTGRVLQQWPDVDMVRSDTNLGFSAGNNLAAERATGEYLLFLNADTEVSVGAVEGLAGFLDEHTEAGAVGPRMVSADGGPQASSGQFPGALAYLRDTLHLGKLVGWLRPLRRRWYPWLDEEGSVKVDYVPGAGLMIRREAFEAVGGWPEAYFFYGEDAELCLRLRETPTPVTCLLRDVEVVHHHGGSVAGLALWNTVAANRGALLFAARNRPALSLLGLRAAILLGNLPRLALCALALPLGALLGKGQALARRVRTYVGVMRLALSSPNAFEQQAP